MIYATSDLHGWNPADFQRLLKKADFGEDDFLFILGDVIDRGEWGAELLLWLTQQSNIQLILGNHEALLLACSFLFEEVNDRSLDRLSVRQLNLVQNWMANGGGPTMTGFRKLLKKDPESVQGILEYLQDAPLYETLTVNGRNYILVHAGLGNFRPGRPLDDYTPEELLMDRPAPEDRYFSNARVILGHTPAGYFDPEHPNRAFRTETWTCIDTGAAMGFPPMLLRLDDGKEIYAD